MVAFFWYLHRSENEQQRQMLYRDVELARQNLLLRWRANQDTVTANSAAWTQLSDAGSASGNQLREFLAANPDIGYVYWMDAQRSIRWLLTDVGTPQPSARPLNTKIEDSAASIAQSEARETGVVQYSPPFMSDFNQAMVEMHLPVYANHAFVGTIAVGYQLQRSLESAVSTAMLKQYKLDIADSGGNVLVSTSTSSIHDANQSYEVVLNPPGRGMRLRAFALDVRPEVFDRLLKASVFGLGTIVLVGLGLLGYFARQRLQAELALAEETRFRRAMEDSLSTGMRAMDMKGRITYVNPAFCRMIGFEESELVGQEAPYPYWPADQIEQHRENLRKLLAGEIPASGLKTEVCRKDGSRLLARMYVSPLRDRRGVQTGWMTSMTDITEPERIREQLRAAHEQFTTVMEQLDAAVCVVEKTPEARLLFRNKHYRGLFGETVFPVIAAVLADPTRDSDTDVSFEANGRWYEMRWRTIRWVDQRDAQLVLATDITLRHDAQTLQREQQERVERTSRLISMGEMASSLAHELNQPLTAISNYTMGGNARLQLAIQKNEPIPVNDLAQMLEKTAKQAERAGKVIRRIREFVKRSEPDRRECSAQAVIEDAIGLAEIDAKRLQMNLDWQPPTGDLPPLYADPILIEQVLLNLIKNAMEANLHTGHHRVEIQLSAEQNNLHFTVADRGHGVAQANRERLFDPFFTTKPDGMGMGLNICRSIVEFHQGRLWMEERAGGGTVFHLQLPGLDQQRSNPFQSSAMTP